MGNQKQFRSEEARKNYEKQERQRALAIRRKEFQVKKADLTGKAKSWLKANPKKAVITAVSVVAVIMLAWLGCKYFVGPGGSIPNFFGTLVGKQDNWLVINTAEDGKTPRYHHLADFDIPEGFQLDNFSVFDDGMQQDFYCTAVEAGGLVRNVYVSGSRNMVAAEYPSILLAYGLHKEATEPKAAVIAGQDAHYISLTFDGSDADGEGMAYRSLCIYIDTGKNACISAVISSETLPENELPDEAALLAQAEVLLAGLTLVK